MSNQNMTVGTVEKKVATRDPSQQPFKDSTRNSEYFVSPPVDILEKADSLVFFADLPGVPKEGLGVNVDKGILTIEGRVGYQFASEALVREFEPVNFYRQFELSETFDLDKISAELKNGVLAVRLPKKAEAKPWKIEVAVS